MHAPSISTETERETTELTEAYDEAANVAVAEFIGYQVAIFNNVFKRSHELAYTIVKDAGENIKKLLAEENLTLYDGSEVSLTNPAGLAMTLIFSDLMNNVADYIEKKETNNASN